jgi:tetratricopeptide (TPR) repeat protein
MAVGSSSSWNGSVRRVAAALILWAAFFTASGEVRSAATSSCDLIGPASDFWPKVVRDWSRRVPGLNAGPSQTPAWVSLVYGNAEGEPGSIDLEKDIRRWAGVQEWNWVRSEIWKRPYSRFARGAVGHRLALRQNLILLGTPASNPLLATALKRVRIRVQPDSLEIGGRVYTGSNLLLIAIFPSPYSSGKYVLCILGYSEEALRGLTRHAFGETDYVLFRGRRPLESGFFEKPRCDSWAPAKHPAVYVEYRGWEALEIDTLRYHFDPARTARAEVEDLARREGSLVEEMSPTLRLPRSSRRIEIYLYASADDKLRETGIGSPVHLEDEAGAVHRVFVPGEIPAYQIATLLLRQHLGGRGSPGLRLALALAATAEFDGRPLDEYAFRLVSMRQLPELDGLSSIEEGSPGEEFQRVLSAASFLRFLISEGRMGNLKQLYLNSSKGSLAGQFRALVGETLEGAERRWAERLISSPSRTAKREAVASLGRSPSEVPEASRRSLERAVALFRARRDADARSEIERALAIAPDLATARILLARIAFRNGDSATAIREARTVLESSRDPEVLSWAHVTIGRAEALRGHRSAAALELRDPEVVRGPEPPRLLADLWLENLGLSPNRKAVEEELRFTARADLQNFDWDSAEQKLKAVLATNPDSAAAHFALSEVYLKHHEYWVERATLSNEIHPATTPLDPSLYRNLADRAERELEKGVVLSTPSMARPGGERPAGQEGRRGPLDDLDLFDPSLRARSASPDERHAHFFLGRGYFFSGDFIRARQELGRSLGQDAGDPRFMAWDYIYLGFIELLEGRKSLAKTYFLEARKLRIGGRVTTAAKKGLVLVEAKQAP